MTDRANDVPQGRRWRKWIAGAIVVAGLGAGIFAVAAMVAADPADNVVIVDPRLDTVAGGMRAVSASLHNRTSDRTYEMISVDLYMLDGEGQEIGRTTAVVSNLVPGATKSFTAPIPSADAVAVRFERISCRSGGVTSEQFCGVGDKVVVR